MSYTIPLPLGGARTTLDVIDPFSSMVQRFLRRDGLAGYEPETAATLLALFEQQDGPFALFDVGANIGLYSHLCGALFPVADVHAFEPTPTTAGICRAIAAANNLGVQVVEAAVSDQAGNAQLHLSETSDASNSLVAGFKQSVTSVTVESLTLDDYWRRTGVAPDILKIDVETHETSVLAGAMRLIEAHRPTVVIEVLRRRDGDQGPSIEAAFSELGYSYYPLSIESDWDPANAIRGSGTSERDWLLTPQPLAPDFADRWNDWHERLSRCTPDRNSRLSVTMSARAAYRRGGLTELWSSARRFARNDFIPALRRRRSASEAGE